MVKNPEILRQFELDYQKNNKLTYAEKLRMFEGMLEFKNKVCPRKDVWSGLDEKIEIYRRFRNAWKTIQETR
jgi:hypothetical protein